MQKSRFEQHQQEQGAHSRQSMQQPTSTSTHDGRSGPAAFMSIPRTTSPTSHDGSIHDRRGLAHESQPHLLTQQAQYTGPTSHPNTAPNESPERRQVEEAPLMQQSRSFLGINDINRKGRASPLPQAVQGAQIQQAGPASEPHIKNEFSRMFSGIGSGAGGTPSPLSATSQGHQLLHHQRRDQSDSYLPLDSPTDHAPRMSRDMSKGGRRKKYPEDELSEDLSNGRTKRTKTHHHHHQ